MKKFTILLLMAALATTTYAAEKVYGQQFRKANVTATPTVKAVKSIIPKMVFSGAKADVPVGYAQISITVMDTETEGGGVWSDGSGYQMLLDADATAYGTIFAETGPLTQSGDASEATYAEFEYKIPENADGSLTTTNVIVSGTVTALIPAGIYDFCITNPTPDDRVWIAASQGTLGGRADDYEFFSGATYYITIYLDDASGNDMTDVEIDDPSAPQVPTELAATPAATFADITWEPGENNASWNLRYRPYVDPALAGMLWDLPDDNAILNEQLEGWMAYDSDGDGANWGLIDNPNGSSDLCFTSASYDYNYGGALTPDNWLFTPEVLLGGTLKFDAWQYSASWLDKFMVYVCTNSDWESVDEFVAISDFIVPSGTSPESFEVSLADYEGMGIIAFRHYDCSNMWRLYLDNVQVIPANPVEIPEWTVVENTGAKSESYTIEGLTPETEYEVQVQGVGEDERVSNWTQSVRFTTLAEDPAEEGIEELYMVGSFNGWNQTEEGGRIAFELADGEFTATTDLEAGAEFKLITPVEGGWRWFGGVDDNQVGYFLINEDLLGVGIDLVEGSNFRIEEAGNYTITVSEAPRGLNEPLKMTVTKNLPTAITDLTVSSSNTWYNIQGMKLQGVPTVPGIYINNGRKVVVK